MNICIQLFIIKPTMPCYLNICFGLMHTQDEVLERAKKSKEKAAREAMEVQGTPLSSDVGAITDMQAHDITQVP